MSEQSRAQILFIDIADQSGLIRARWQSAWINQTVTWEGVSWNFQRITWSGLTSGALSGTQATITLPHMESLDWLHEETNSMPWLARLRVYQIAESLQPATGPSADQMLVNSTFGELMPSSISVLSSVSYSVGPILPSYGTRFPSILATDKNVGVPALL